MVDVLLWLGIGGSFLGILISAWNLWKTFQIGASDPHPATLDEKLVELTDQLGSAARAISAIEGEIEERKELVERLRAEAERAETLKDLSAREAAAVTEAIEGALASQPMRKWDIKMVILSVALSSVAELLPRPAGSGACVVGPPGVMSGPSS